MSGALVVLGMDPVEVSTHLGLDPDRTWLAGERKMVRLPDGRVTTLSSVHDRPGWKKFAPDDLVEPSQAIAYWLEVLRSRESAFRQISATAATTIEVLFQEN